MNRLLKTLLLWLLLAALPVQGMAAATMAACGSTSHAGSAPTSFAGHHQHEAATAMSTRSVAHDHTASDTSPYKAHHVKHDASVCGACANCCPGALALSPAPISIPQRATTITPPAYPFPLVTSFIPPAPERPPKRLVA